MKKLPVMKLIRDKEVVYLFCPQFQSCDDITKFGLFVFDCYIANFIKLGFVISGFFSIHFTVTLSGLKDIICCIGDFVKWGFHCTSFPSSTNFYFISVLTF